MNQPYTALTNHTIKYIGNKVFNPIDDIQSIDVSSFFYNSTVSRFATDEHLKHLHEVESTMFFTIIDFFRKQKADWCNLPLTTLMISSPGEIYAGKTLDYTTDALPIKLNWFDTQAFLAESSQFYLELRLLIPEVQKVFSVYNSFRKEKADYTHLSEFQHVEYEAKASLNDTIATSTNLLKAILREILVNNLDDLLYYLNNQEVEMLHSSFDQSNLEIITFKEGLNLLYKETENKKYKDFSLQHFGAWEEVKLTEIIGKHLWVTEYPLLQTSFYHKNAKKTIEGIPVAENADLIFHGYREVLGAGTRIADPKVLAEKSRIFNLPIEDYKPYFEMRQLDTYETTSGFGLGWQRLVHWLLKLPTIIQATHMPRGHFPPKP